MKFKTKSKSLPWLLLKTAFLLMLLAPAILALYILKVTTNALRNLASRSHNGSRSVRAPDAGPGSKKKATGIFMALRHRFLPGGDPGLCRNIRRDSHGIRGWTRVLRPRPANTLGNRIRGLLNRAKGVG